MAIACGVRNDIACYTTLYLGSALLALAWVVGPAVGTRLGTGLNGGETFLSWALGFLSTGALFAASTLIGVAVDPTTPAWGMIVGAPLAAVAGVFLTPLYAVALYGDRDPSLRSPTLEATPFLVPGPDGIQGGVRIAF